MTEHESNAKKAWVAPALEVLEIEKTLGGTVDYFFESQVSSINTRGSFPG